MTWALIMLVIPGLQSYNGVEVYYLKGVIGLPIVISFRDRWYYIFLQGEWGGRGMGSLMMSSSSAGPIQISEFPEPWSKHTFFLMQLKCFIQSKLLIFLSPTWKYILWLMKEITSLRQFQTWQKTAHNMFTSILLLSRAMLYTLSEEYLMIILWSFSPVLHKNICCGYSLVPRQGASNEYPQLMFSQRNKKNYPRIITKYSSLTSPLIIVLGKELIELSEVHRLSSVFIDFCK